jgi:hypothetical protein
MTRATPWILMLALAQQLGAQAGPPSRIEQKLSTTFRTWHFATFAADYGGSVPATGSPTWIRGDFDGDTRTDFAVQVVTTEGHDSVQRVIAFLERGRGYVGVLADSFPVSVTAYLVLARSGEERADLDADPDGRTRVRLRHDAVDIVFAETAALTCLYRSTVFRCITSGD